MVLLHVRTSPRELYSHCTVQLYEQAKTEVTQKGHVLTHIKIAEQRTNTVIGTLAVDGWAVTFGTARWGLLVLPNVTAHPSTASVPTSYYLMRYYNCFWL